ncbi:MAG TPA: creatininase family protein [Gemmatimonadaceae bacterium]|nr:creatininase family protein [Gemmatimonadaceae bacterium]
MKRLGTALVLSLFVVSPIVAQAPGPKTDLVEFEMMTWPEVLRAIHEQGKTTALVYNGGTEQRGPQNVNGGHTLMGRATVRAIALKLGNAIAAPVMPFSMNNASPTLPGTIGLSSAAFALINEEVAEQLIKSGFTTVILMGDHGGGQKELGEVAARLDAKYSPQGIHVFFCDEVYAKANGDFDAWLKENGYPSSSHAGIPDTSEMLYLGGDSGWVRKDLIATAVGDPVQPRGAARDPNVKRVNNGITGDARPSTAKLGERIFQMKVDYAVAQINRLMANAKKP